MSGSESKIIMREEAIKRAAEARLRGQVVGFTSGVFDLIHRGHLQYLETARAQCDLLIVGVNSDRSVRELKGPRRPICSVADRMRVVAGFAAVDLVFEFDETTNRENVGQLKPHRYFKAGDYTKERLTSAALVESQGGTAVVLPFHHGRSSSEIVDTILSRYSDVHPLSLPIPSAPRAPAVFLDRDGTLIEHVEYLHEPEKMRPIAGAMEALRQLREKGYRIIVVTNQPGIGMGYYSKEQFFAVNRAMLKAASDVGATIDRVYFCPHGKGEECECRKPLTGMVMRAARDLNIDLTHSVVVGDMTSDLELAHRSGCSSVLVRTGRGGQDGLYEVTPSFVADDLHGAAAWILARPIPPIPVAPPLRIPEIEGPTTLEAIGKVTGKIGHDINNLLGAIRGSVDLIKIRLKKALPDQNPVERQIAIIESAMQKAIQLTGKIRSFVRPGPIERSRIRLKACVESTLDVLRASESGPFEVMVQSWSDPEVEIGEYQVSQMVLGLCANALEASYGLPERVLVVQIEEQTLVAGNPLGITPGRYARLSITDHGSGLKEGIEEHLFAPFVTTKESAIGKGFGLTLPMAHQIMVKHGGAIALRSQPGCGTVVSLFFPCHEPVTAAPASASSSG